MNCILPFLSGYQCLTFDKTLHLLSAMVEFLHISGLLYLLLKIFSCNELYFRKFYVCNFPFWGCSQIFFWVTFYSVSITCSARWISIIYFRLSMKGGDSCDIHMIMLLCWFTLYISSVKRFWKELAVFLLLCFHS